MISNKKGQLFAGYPILVSLSAAPFPWENSYFDFQIFSPSQFSFPQERDPKLVRYFLPFFYELSALFLLIFAKNVIGLEAEGSRC